MAVKTFSVGETLTASDTNTYLNNGGLVYVASATGTAVGNIAVNSCFSATYDMYLVTVAVTASANSALLLRLRSGTTDKTTNYSWGGFYLDMASALPTLNPESGVSTGLTSGFRIGSLSTAGMNNSFTQIGTPFTTTRTSSQSQPQGAETYFRVFSGYQSENYSADGINVVPSSGTITGTVRVYGYRQA